MVFKKDIQSKEETERFSLFSNQGIVAFIIFLLLMILIGFSWRTALRDVEDTRRELVSERARYLKTNIDLRIGIFNNSLLGGAGLFRGSTLVTRAEWREYVNTLDIFERYPGVVALGYAHLVSGDTVGTFEERLRADGFEDFAVRPDNASDREKLAIITYIEPFENENLFAFGYDMYSDVNRRAAMDEAAIKGQSAVTRRVQLVQDNENPQPGIVMYYPLYDETLPTETEQERLAALRGYIYSPFRSLEIFDGIFDENETVFDFKVYDGVEISDQHKLFDSNLNKDVEDMQSVGEEKINVLNREWVIQYFASDDIVPEVTRNRPRGVLFGGTIFSLIIAGIVYLLLQRRARLLLYKKELDVQIAKDEMLSLASHQLRTPATGVKQYIGMVLEGFTDDISDKQRDVLTKAYQSNERQLSIINEFLYLAKADAGRIVVSPQKIDIKDMTAKIIEDMKLDIEKENHTVKFNKYKGSLDVYADPHGARMIIENIISNAIKYTPRGGKITITLDKSARYGILRVADSGVGIPADSFKLLFRQFSRIPNELTQYTSGSGIGLYLAKKLAELNHGRIGVESRVGEGSTFTIKLPLKNVKNHTERHKNK